jgi:hypothetical protein
MPVFYEQMARGTDPEAAVWTVRQALHDGSGANQPGKHLDVTHS